MQDKSRDNNIIPVMLILIYTILYKIQKLTYFGIMKSVGVQSVLCEDVESNCGLKNSVANISRTVG